MATPSISRLYTGVSELTKQLSQNLINNSVITNIFSMKDEFTYQDSIKCESPFQLKLNLYSTYGPQIIGYNPKIKWDMLDIHADFGHIQALWSYTAYALHKWACQKNKPFLLSSNGYLDEWAMNNSRIKKKIALMIGFDKIITKASCIQVNSSTELNALRKKGLKNPIAVIANGVVIPLKIEKSKVPPWVSVETSFGKKILLYLGRIHPKKGVDLLLAAWKLMTIQPSMSSWHLVIVGFKNDEDGYEKSCKNYVKFNNLDKSVTLLNGCYGEEMVACYENSDAFILPSFSEGNPIAVLNAMAYSKPILITDGCNIAASKNNEFGLNIQSDIESIARGLYDLSFLSNTQLADMGKSGRKYIEMNQSWSVIASKYARVYDWMRNPTPDSDDIIIT